MPSPSGDALPNPILTRMLERLYAAILDGPNMACRPHHSRQRVDLAQFQELKDLRPGEALRTLLTPAATVRIAAKVPLPPGGAPSPAWRRGFQRATQLSTPVAETPPAGAAGSDAQEKARAQKAWQDQQRLLAKLRIIADEARVYENDTGVSVLSIGFPLLAAPPGAIGSGSRRILAPVAFVPLQLAVTSGASQVVELTCREDGLDRVTPNAALLSWIEQQTGRPSGELFADEEGAAAWKEILQLVTFVAQALELRPPEPLCAAEMPALELQPCPRAEEMSEAPAILLSAVLGLFPLSNQGLVRDTRAMCEDRAITGPVRQFLAAAAAADLPQSRAEARSEGPRRPRFFDDERLVAQADPFQARAVRAARDSLGLVVHGPPGTGKSQTITNVIGDHLAHGQRVLFVCDKRTALDVVANRLRALGLGALCAVVHDPQRDQKDLYRQLRERLESLTGEKTSEQAQSRLAKLDAELSKLHADLWTTHKALHGQAGTEGVPFHERVGQWLRLQRDGGRTPAADLREGLTLDVIEQQATSLRDLFTRAERVGYSKHAWKLSAGMDLQWLLRQPMQELRERLTALCDAARTLDAHRRPDAIPFSVEGSALDQAKSRGRLADELERLVHDVRGEIRDQVASKVQDAAVRSTGMSTVRMLAQSARDAKRHLDTVRSGSLDADLQMALAGRSPQAPLVAGRLAALREYEQAAQRWWAFAAFGAKRRAAAVLRDFGQPLSLEAARRSIRYLEGYWARLHLQQVCDQALGRPPSLQPQGDAELLAEFQQVCEVTEWVERLELDASLAPLRTAARQALASGEDAARRQQLLTTLREAGPWAEQIATFESVLAAAPIVGAERRKALIAGARCAEAVAPACTSLEGGFDGIEDVLRVEDSLGRLPADLARTARKLIEQGLSADDCHAAVLCGGLRREIDLALAHTPALNLFDGGLIQTQLDRYQELCGKKCELVRDAVLHGWTTRQKQRLLADNGTRMSSAGADMKRRLALRGPNALRLRQVVAAGFQRQQASGAGNEAGPDDPLFDLAPVWLASPETVAQIFPRRPLFDIVMFDEASQVRLEEALPVLTRAKRVFIAGDPKQLPPTRFFETGLVESQEPEPTTEQELFEVHQSGVEDLLEASLGLDIPQCYLDVHYRSKYPQLIEFSNANFYGGRLQPLPGHPDRKPPRAPVLLHRIDGAYEERCNEAEAQRVVALVRELLAQENPPSIGVACFNVTQRDLIAEKLDEAVAEDEDFAGRLAKARARQGQGAFEGFFVKNLENVQGDERDVMIISTTYGPDPSGRFYRRFGPLGQPGGGRRLNVLVTRARTQVHVLTSIPREAYLSLPPIPEGQAPSGGWLLLRYLKFAEELTQAFTTAAPQAVSIAPSAEPHEDASAFAIALASELSRENGAVTRTGWGNAGFCIDVLARPAQGDGPSTGILCDFHRFSHAEDPIDWESFRLGIFKSMGWRTVRAWSPQYLRDPQGARARIARELGTPPA